MRQFHWNFVGVDTSPEHNTKQANQNVIRADYRQFIRWLYCKVVCNYENFALSETKLIVYVILYADVTGQAFKKSWNWICRLVAICFNLDYQLCHFPIPERKKRKKTLGNFRVIYMLNTECKEKHFRWALESTGANVCPRIRMGKSIKWHFFLALVRNYKQISRS